VAGGKEKAAEKKKFVTTSINKGRKLDEFIKPMLAGEAEAPFDDDDWLFEIKWDGYRAIAEVNDKKVSLYSRNGISFLHSYPLIAAQLRELNINAIIDGEIVVLNEAGEPNFQLLQHYAENMDKPLMYNVFDLLSLDGHDTTQLSLIQRKELLEKLLPENPVIRYSDHIYKEGKAFFKISTERDLEGIIGKNIHSNYLPGKRTREWLKIKNQKTTEAIIAGYTAPAGSRKYFGALVLAMLKDGKLIYSGHTGTGFNQKLLKDIFEALQPLVQTASPFEKKIKTNMPVTWVKPELVCEIKYSEKTRDGLLRHPVFLHLRPDKNATDIISEENTGLEKNAGSKKSRAETSSKKKKTTPGSGKPPKTVSGPNETILQAGGHKLTVTNLDKIYFPDDGFTKGDVINYYISIADYILPYLKGRPENLLRNPNGINQPGFYHKDAGEIAPSFLDVEQVDSASSQKVIDYIVCNNLPTLLYMNNLGCIEINPWHSRKGMLDKPDYLIIDIDPSSKNTFEQVVETALVLKEILNKAGAPSYCKTSGATGMHIYVPAGKKYTYDQVKDFAYIICMLANEQLKKFTTLERNLKKRGNKHIYLDYLQNRRGQTISSVYSLRPKRGGTVSTPLLWNEVKNGLSPQQFTIQNTLERISSVGDIFKGVLGTGINIKKCLDNLGS
jgi:bifunctional non-homologous end joining protein LigD